MSYKNLEVYKLSRLLSSTSWKFFNSLPKHIRFNLGSQLLRSADSVGANIAEGYGRYHYLDSTKFYYNARGSLYETEHWLEILYERGLIEDGNLEDIRQLITKLGVKLNNFIKANKRNLK